MRITQQFASHFADEWIKSWNKKDIAAIMNHYTDGVIFSSPFIIRNKINTSGTIKGKDNLKKYFEKALAATPDLHFDLEHIMIGIKSITLIYVRIQTLLASETMILDYEGKVIEGLSHYPLEDIYSLLK